VLFVPVSAEVEALQAMVTRRSQLLGMRTAEKNRFGEAVLVLHESILAVLEALDVQIAQFDKAIDSHLKEHFEELAKRFEAINGVGTTT
jgi:transposase